jgi:hypothetical protein
MKHFITNTYKIHTFVNIVRNLITSRSRLSLEMFLINVESDFLKKNLPKIYWKVYEIKRTILEKT